MLKINRLNHLSLAVFIVIIALMAVPRSVHALDKICDDKPSADPDYQTCAECHIDVVADWQDSIHATTYHSPAFQDAIADGADSSCLECHTTCYSPVTGEVGAEGVTCEACHGTTPENHPEEPVPVLNGVDVCAECHLTTYHEWEISPHGVEDMPCTTCHNPHPQQIRFETTNELCLNCHGEDVLTGFAHETHVENACTDCHWHRGEFDTDAHIATGVLSPTGHEGDVETLACTSCHENTEEYLASREDGVEVAMASRVEVAELEAEINTVRAQGENSSAVHLIQGIVVGIALGGILIILIARLRPGRFDRRNGS